jgi:hypothetical protein
MQILCAFSKNPVSTKKKGSFENSCGKMENVPSTEFSMSQVTSKGQVSHSIVFDFTSTRPS